MHGLIMLLQHLEKIPPSLKEEVINLGKNSSDESTIKAANYINNEL